MSSKSARIPWRRRSSLIASWRWFFAIIWENRQISIQVPLFVIDFSISIGGGAACDLRIREKDGWLRFQNISLLRFFLTDWEDGFQRRKANLFIVTQKICIEARGLMQRFCNWKRFGDEDEDQTSQSNKKRRWILIQFWWREEKIRVDSIGQAGWVYSSQGPNT